MNKLIIYTHYICENEQYFPALIVKSEERETIYKLDNQPSRSSDRALRFAEGFLMGLEYLIRDMIKNGVKDESV